MSRYRSIWIALTTGLLLLPVVVFSYLPMTDLPQHLAIVTILDKLGDAHYGFDAFYEPAPLRTMYWLPYALVLALSRLVGIEIAMRCMVVLTVALYPLGVAAVLRALGKPPWLGLLALPLVYNRAFFWGFLHMNMAIGLGLLAWAVWMRPQRNRAGDLLLLLLTTAAVLTHPYGAGMIVGLVLLSALVGERRDWWRRSLPVLPAPLGVVVWSRLAQAAPTDATYFDSFEHRLWSLPSSVLGGYADFSEELLLLLLTVTVAVLSRNQLLIPGRGWWSTCPAHERAIRAFAVVNLALYFLMPTHSSSFKIIHFRHGLIAVLVLPLITTTIGMGRTPRLAKSLLGALVAATLLNAWFHLWRFDSEARGFDEVLRQLPEQPRIVALTPDTEGSVMLSHPYWHFSAYAQARKGGLISYTFPAVHWNIPLKLREEAHVPPTPEELFMRPELYDHETFGWYYDHALVRGNDPAKLDAFRVSPFELVYERSPWRLYRLPSAGGKR